jgi:hypothetical protein
MTDFEREPDIHPGYGYSDDAPTNAPAWIAGVLVVVLIIGGIAYSGHRSDTQTPAKPSAVHEMTPPAPLIPAPPAEAPKPQ